MSRIDGSVLVVVGGWVGSGTVSIKLGSEVNCQYFGLLLHVQLPSTLIPPFTFRLAQKDFVLIVFGPH